MMCLIFFLLTLLIAQQPAPEQPKTAVLEGRVVHSVSGESIRKARVTLELSGAEHESAYVAVTDDKGHFRFADIQFGTYKLIAERTGFLESQYGADKPGGPGTLLTVGSNDPTSQLTLRLFPGGIINGRILDAEGDPISGIQVILWRQRHARHKAIHSRVSQTTANQIGEYRFDSLLPGSYYVSADVGTWGYVIRPIPVDGEGKVTKIHDLTTFYPAALLPAEAQAIRLESGQEQAGMDIHLQRGPTFRVQGRIAGVSGSLPKCFLSATVDQGLGWTSETGRILSTGEFIFEGLPPGRHLLHLMGPGENEAQVIGQAEVNLTDRDVTGIVITPFKPAQIHVRVVREGDENHSLTAGSVFLIPVDGREDNAIDQAEYLTKDGVYVFPSVTPGQYHVWFNNASDCYLKAIQAGGQTLNTNRIDVSEALNLDLLLVFSKSVAAILGEVQTLQDQVAHSAHVTLIAQGPSLHLNSIYYAKVDQLLHFDISNMPPGQYAAFATEDNLDLWDNEEFTKLLQPEGFHVDLREKQQAALQLKLIPKQKTDRIRQQLGL